MTAVREPAQATPAADRPLRVGVVIAVRNEARWLDGLLTSLEGQEGFEAVCRVALVDGRSEDGTREILERWRRRLPVVTVLDNDARIAPVGFNLGIRACLEAGAETILLVSGHCSLHEGFLAEAQRVLASDEGDIVGCVLDYPPPTTAFEKASQAFVESRLGRRQGSFSRLTRPQPTAIATFPAIRCEVFGKVGLFDETMVRNQDIEFTQRARAAGFRIVTAPAMRCRYAPPSTLRHLVRQMYGNGLWVGRRILAHGLRHLAPAVFVSGAVIAGLLAAWRGQPWTAIWAALAGFYALAILVASISWLPRARAGALWLPLVFLLTHVAYAFGTIRGILSRGGGRKVPRE